MRTGGVPAWVSGCRRRSRPRSQRCLALVRNAGRGRRARVGVRPGSEPDSFRWNAAAAGWSLAGVSFPGQPSGIGRTVDTTRRFRRYRGYRGDPRGSGGTPSASTSPVLLATGRCPHEEPLALHVVARSVPGRARRARLATAMPRRCIEGGSSLLAGFSASAVGAVTAAALLASALRGLNLGPLSASAEPLAVVLVTLVIACLSLIFGELTPKNLAVRDARPSPLRSPTLSPGRSGPLPRSSGCSTARPAFCSAARPESGSLASRRYSTLGRIPEVGDRIELPGARVDVLRMSGNRVALVRFTLTRPRDSP